MKKIIYNFSLIAAILFTSCDALDLVPEDFYGSGNFWKNSSQVEGYMNGLSTYLRSDYVMFYVLGETRGGTQRIGTSSLNTSLDYAVIRSQLLTKDNTGISNWYGLYTPIMRINLAITEMENGCDFLSESEKRYYLGQAYGLRALYYFMLYRTYGGVPIVTEVEILNGKVTAEKFYVERATPEATMNFLKEDIARSESYFGSDLTVTKNQWSKYATLMLKAEIHMWAAKVSVTGFTATGQTDLSVARAALNEIIGNFSLVSDFGSIFSTSNKECPEIIFTLHFADNEAYNWGAMFLSQDAVFIDQIYGRDGIKITTDTLNLRGTGGVFRNEYLEEFWKTYDAEDTRRDATFLEYYQSKNEDSGELSGFGCVMLKGIGSINSNNNRIYNSDIPVYRYADALLMMAECENGLGNPCASYINRIRRRAYGSNYAGHEYTEASFAENELAILHERDKEFVWEGKRWFDVVRMHDASGKSLAFSNSGNYPATSPLLNQDEAHKLLWPVDASTLSVNTMLEQTLGY
jgi:hypothetical protein